MGVNVRSVLLAVAVLLAAYFAFQFFLGYPYGTLTASGSVSPTSVEPGQSVTLTLSSFGGVYGGIDNISYIEDAYTGWCGTDNFFGDYYCFKPFSVAALTGNRCDSLYYLAVFAADGSGGISYDPTYDDFGIDEWQTPFSHSKVLVYGLVSSATTPSYSSLTPFMQTSGTGYPYDIEVRLDLRWYDQANSVSKPFVGVCQRASSAFTVSARATYGTSSVVGPNTWTGPDGYTYYCRFGILYPSSSYTYDSLIFNAAGIDYPSYILVGDTCYLNGRFGYSLPCNDAAGYTKKVRLAYIKFEKGGVDFYVYPNGISGVAPQSAGALYDFGLGSVESLGQSSFTFTIPSTVAEGTYDFGITVYPSAYCDFYGGSYSATYKFTATITGTTFTVINYADSVTINSVSVSSSDDEVASASLTVSGGATFDYVTVSSSCGGSTTINRSSFSCSGTTCTWSGTLGFDTTTSGQVTSPSTTCTVTAALYANGSQRSADSATVTVYFPQISNLVANDSTSASVSYSFQACGAFSKYKVYVDGQYVETKTVSPPATPGACQSVSSTTSSPLITPGSHTLEIRLYTSDEGEYASASDTFNANYTYSYSITNFTVSTPEKHVQNASSDTFSGSIGYYTTDPNGAHLEVREGGTTLWTSNVASGSGTRTWSANLSCGAHTLTAVITPVGDTSAVKDSRNATATLYCWNVSVGPSGAVQIPSSGGVPLPSARVDAYYDVSVTPDANYTVQVLWDGTDITSKFGQCSGHTACATLTQSDVPIACGGSATLTLNVYYNNAQVATATSSITFQCVEQYVIFRLPTDGSAYDTFGDDVPADFNLPVAVDYAGGDAVRFYLDDLNNEVSVAPVACSELNVSADACYTLSGSYLDPGDHNLYARLFSGSTVIAEDSVSFTIYAWSFAYLPSLSGDVGVLSVKEYASHAQSCRIEFPDLNVSSQMSYSEASRTWDYPVDKATYDGASFTITCYSPTGSEVYVHSDAVKFGVAAAPGGGGAAVPAEEKPPEAPPVIPFWPDYAVSGGYQWSVLGKDVFLEAFDNVSVSSTLVCVKPRDALTAALYCPTDMPAIPVSGDTLSKVLEVASECSSLGTKSVGEFTCVDNEGTGIYVFRTPKGEINVLVAGGPQFGAGVYVVAAIAVVFILIYLYYSGVIRL